MAAAVCKLPVAASVCGGLSAGHRSTTTGSAQSNLAQVPALPQFSGLRSNLRLSQRITPVTKMVRRSAQVKALLNPQDDPILNEAFKEPVAFFGGLFSGLLRLDLKEEPLKDWLEKTADAAGVKPDGSSAGVVVEDDEGPIEIDIEID